MESDPNGPLYVLSSGDKAIQKKWLVIRFQHLAMAKMDDLARMAAQMLTFTKATRQSLKNWVRHRLPVPDCCQIIAQPFIQMKTSCGVWAVAGSKTGEIAQWYPHLNIQYNGQNKTWAAHYTVWLGAAIINPLNIHIQPDVKFEGYVRGLDDSIISRDNWRASNIEWPTLGSCFVFASGATFSKSYARKEANPLPLFGVYDRKYIATNYPGQQSRSTTPKYPGFVFYNMIWDFSSINGRPFTAPDSYQSLRNNSFISGIMPMGTQKVYDTFTKQVSKLCYGTGHLDPHDGPLKEMLSGRIKFQKTIMQ